MAIDPGEKCEACENIDSSIVISDREGLLERETTERQLVRKLDTRFLPAMMVVFFMNYIDRVAITSARLKGLQTDLHLSDVQYDTVVAILYASYCPAQIPSNMALNYVSRPTFYIGGCVVLWGLTSALTGVTHNFAGVAACRFFIGLPEAAFYPGAIYLLSRWYTRQELSFRSVILYAGLLVSNSFGSLFAAAILGKMDYVMSVAAWRWLFYIEGAMTMAIGFLAMWLLPDYPHNTRWLTPEERHLAQVRLAEDVGEADMDSKEASIFEGLKLALKDPRVLIFMVMSCCQVLGLSFAVFLPTLTATLGYSTTITLLLGAPPWLFTAIVALITARHADVTGERFFHLCIGWWAAVVGCIISLSTMHIAGRYFSIFLMTCGFCGASLICVWVANVIHRPPAKRSVAIALVNGFGNLGNLAGSYIWKASWGPKYHQSMVICICAFVCASSLAFVMRTLLVRENKRLERTELDLAQGRGRERVEEAARLEGITFDEAVRRRMGFRYLY